MFLAIVVSFIACNKKINKNMNAIASTSLESQEIEDIYQFKVKTLNDEDFDFSNCIFIAEAYDDSEIPLNKTSTYFVHCAYNPAKYIGKVGKFIDMRYNLKKIDHPNYVYELECLIKMKTYHQHRQSCFHLQFLDALIFVLSLNHELVN